jgi:tyrosyl-tRNA synthetase
MTLFDELTWRGLLHQVTHPELNEHLEKAPLSLYCGFDPTADSLHIGSMIPIIGLAHFQRAGHTPIILVGGGTGLIGDPSGKSDERTLLTKEGVDANVQGIQKQLAQFLDFDGDYAAIIVNNADWLCPLTLVDFLRDIGKHFTVNTMLNKESVRQRLQDRDHGISYTEFTYSILQAYDFLHLAQNHNCQLQIGGSDQWGNIVAGMDLARRMLKKETYGLTLPLVTKSDGGKFGKSESGNIWLDPNRTSPFNFYQFWLNQTDADTPKYLKYFTFLPQDEIAELEKQIQDEPHKRAAQKALAEDVTRRVHGEQALQNALAATQAIFGGDLTGLDEATLLDIFSEVPSNELPASNLTNEAPLLDILVETKIFPSKGEARRMLKSGGLYLNNQRVEADDTKLTPTNCLPGNIAIIRKGKKNYHLLRFL